MKRFERDDCDEQDYCKVVKNGTIGMQAWQGLMYEMQDDKKSRSVIGPFVTKWHDMIIADMNMLNTMKEVQQQNKKARDALLDLLDHRIVDQMLGVKVPEEEKE